MKTNNTSLAVIGAGGFIGQFLLRQLAQRELREIVLIDINAPAGLPKNGRFVRTDIRNPKEVLDALAGVDGVFHLSSRSFPQSLQDPRSDFEVGPFGTFNILEAARAHQIKKVIFTSSFLVYGECKNFPVTEDILARPISPYGASKLSSEVYCHTYSHLYGVPSAVVRFSNVYGPGQTGPYLISNVAEKILRKEKISVFGTGNQTRDFVYVEDAVDALVRLMESEITGEVLNIASGQESSILDVIRTLEQLSGHPVEIEFLPARKGDVEKFYLDIQKARNLIAFHPKTSLREGLRQVWQALVEKTKVNI